jgi:hypothetical protein
VALATGPVTAAKNSAPSKSPVPTPNRLKHEEVETQRSQRSEVRQGIGSESASFSTALLSTIFYPRGAVSLTL